MSSLAERLYGPPAAPETTAAPAPAPTPASRLYAPAIDAPAPAEHQPAADSPAAPAVPASRLYGASPDAGIVKIMKAAAEAGDLPPEAVQATAITYSTLQAALGADSADVDLLTSAHARTQGLDEVGRIQLQHDSIRALNAEFGQNAKAAFDAARELVASDPRLGRMLDRGAGDHPEVVVRLAQLGLKARRR